MPLVIEGRRIKKDRDNTREYKRALEQIASMDLENDEDAGFHAYMMSENTLANPMWIWQKLNMYKAIRKGVVKL